MEPDGKTRILDIELEDYSAPPDPERKELLKEAFKLIKELDEVRLRILLSKMGFLDKKVS